MLRLAILASCALLCASAAATSLVEVAVANPAERTLKLSYVTDPVTGRVRIFKVDLRDDNTATFELALEAPTELLLEHGELELPIYVGPEDDLAIAVDAAAGIESVDYTGTAAADNRFLAAFAKTFPAGPTEELGGGFLPFRAERSVLAEAAPGDVDRFAKWAYADFDARANLIDRLAPGVDPGLVQAYRTRNRYRTELNKAAYLLANQALLDANGLARARGRLTLADPSGTRDAGLLENADFTEYLKAYAQVLALPNNGGHDERNGEALFAAIAEGLQRPWRHYLQAELLVNAFDYLGNPDFGLDRYPALQRDGAADAYQQRVENAYGDVLNLSPGSLAPNVGMVTAEGAPLSLTDLSGQVAYVSFWASWCKPCIANFEKYDAVREELAKRGVVLLNVSIDDDELAWKRSLAEISPRGVNTRATDIDGTKRSYNLSMIPAYYIVDRRGRIAVLPEGERRDLIASFDALLADRE